MIISIASLTIDIDQRLYHLSHVIRSMVETFSAASADQSDFSFRIDTARFKYAPYMKKARMCNDIRFYPVSDHATIFWINDNASFFDWDERTVTLYVRPHSEQFDSYILRNLKLLLMLVANRRGWLMLHASGIRKNNSLVVFCGRSGIGKSTTANHFCKKGWQLLNDECIIIHIKGSSLHACSTPFCRMELIDSCNQWMGEVNALFFLIQASAPAIQAVPKSEKFKLLLKNGFILPIDDAVCARHTEICYKLSTYDCIHRLGAINDPVMVDFVSSFLAR